jgi:hypothetical protein
VLLAQPLLLETQEVVFTHPLFFELQDVLLAQPLSKDSLLQDDWFPYNKAA